MEWKLINNVVLIHAELLKKNIEDFVFEEDRLSGQIFRKSYKSSLLNNVTKFTNSQLNFPKT